MFYLTTWVALHSTQDLEILLPKSKIDNKLHGSSLQLERIHFWKLILITVWQGIQEGCLKLY